MLLPCGIVDETRYDRLIRCAALMRLDMAAFAGEEGDDKKKRRSKVFTEYAAYLANTIMEYLGTRIRNIVPAAVFHMPGWLAQTIWDIMSFNGRVETQQGDLRSVKRRHTPIPTLDDLIPMLVENHLPKIPLPKDTYLSPRDLAEAVIDTLRQAEDVAQYAPNELAMFAAALRNIAYDARQGLFDQEGGGPQFQRSLFNLALIGAFDHPELRGKAALTPSMNRESMAILEKIQSRVTVAPVLSQITIYGRGSIDGVFATGTLYSPKLPVCQGTLFEYEEGALQNYGVVRLNMKEVATLDWNLDHQLMAVIDQEAGALRYSSGSDEALDRGAIRARVPLRMMYQEDMFDKPYILDDPRVRYIFEHGEWKYRMRSEFRNKVVTTMSDNEYMLDMLMNPGTRVHVGKVSIEMMNLDKLTNVVLIPDPKPENAYVVPPVTGFPVTYFVSTGDRGFQVRTESVDMRSIYGYANYMARPALAPNVRVPEDVLHTPRPAEVARIAAILGLDDLAAEASHHLLTISYNAAWYQMCLGQSPDPQPLLNLYTQRRTRLNLS